MRGQDGLLDVPGGLVNSGNGTLLNQNKFNAENEALC